MRMSRRLAVLLPFLVGAIPTAAMADTIDPTSYAATLGVGESVTITKTVTIEAGDPTGALLDVVFVIDTSGSMGSFIANAKTAATGILAGLDAFGDLASGTGYYSDPGSDGLFRPLTTNAAQQQQNINDIVLNTGGNGGDFPEEGFNAVKQAAEGSAWRAGSNRFVIALGDATFKESDGATQANTIAALDAANATFIGINFSNMTNTGFGGFSPAAMAAATGGSILSGGLTPASLTAAILAGISGAFSTYDSVSVSDLGAGLPGVGVSVVCTSAAAGGACVGGSAVGDYDRSVDRTFTYDVTFTGLEEGVWAFDTHAIVDGGIVASEADRITVGEGSPVPEPTSLLLVGLGLFGLGVARRRAA